MRWNVTMRTKAKKPKEKTYDLQGPQTTAEQVKEQMARTHPNEEFVSAQPAEEAQ